MTLVLIFGMVLLVAVLLSEVANRTVLSSAVLFPVAGFFFRGILGWIWSVEHGWPSSANTAAAQNRSIKI